MDSAFRKQLSTRIGIDFEAILQTAQQPTHSLHNLQDAWKDKYLHEVEQRATLLERNNEALLRLANGKADQSTVEGLGTRLDELAERTEDLKTFGDGMLHYVLEQLAALSGKSVAQTREDAGNVAADYYLSKTGKNVGSSKKHILS